MTEPAAASEVTLTISSKLLRRLKNTLEFDTTLEQHMLALLSDGLERYELDVYGFVQDGE